MKQVYVKYNPYRLKTTIVTDGQEIPEDSGLYKLTKGKRLQEWVGKFPQRLRDEYSTMDFSLEFCGMDLDWDDFKESFEQARNAGIVKVSSMKYIAGKTDEDVTDIIIQIFSDLQAGPIDDFRSPKLVKNFENIKNSVFPINVIATMSSGKSTLINALLRTKLMPSKNEACTATITEILDTDKDTYSAVVYDEDGEVIEEIPRLTYEEMSRLNENEKVYRICAEGDIPFLDSRSMALELVDTPGPNNSQNPAHMTTTYRAINNSSNNLILYVLNGTQLSTDDDANLLNAVSEKIREGGKQMRDRFLFVVNKMDQFNPEEEDIGKAIDAARKYLARHGIEDPQLFPCSAFTALNIRNYFADVDIDNLTRAEQRSLPQAAKDTLPMIDKFIEYENMHLEKYTTLSPSAQSELDYRLSQAVKRGDTKEQALIHSGICSIEAAITAYVKKYAKTKQIKDLVETFEEILEEKKIWADIRKAVATDEEEAKACVARSEAVRRKIADGKEAKAFKDKIEGLDPMPELKEKADQLEAEAELEATRIFFTYGDIITSRDEAKRLVKQFTDNSSHIIAKLTAELDSEINREIVETGSRLLEEYKEKLSKFDEETSDSQLDFQTVDLVRGALSTMREAAESWNNDIFATETVDEVGEVSQEYRVYYEKVGQEEEEVIVGSHEEKIGTKKVKVGSHREWVGTRQVRNPSKRWWKFFTPKYIDEDVYETVDDYKDEDVYKTVMDYQTIMKDVYEERREQIEKFSVKTADIQDGLIGKLMKSLRDGIEDAKNFAGEQVKSIKDQFSDMFDKLDEVIMEKYNELEKCATDQKEKEKHLEESRRLLRWIEGNKAEIDAVLDV